HVHHPLQKLRIAPEHVKGLIENFALIAAVDEDRMQRPVKILPAADARRLDGGEGLDHPAGTHRQAGAAQRAGEMQDILRKSAAIDIAGVCHAVSISLLIRWIIIAASLPCTLAMSS